MLGLSGQVYDDISLNLGKKLTKTRSNNSEFDEKTQSYEEELWDLINVESPSSIHDDAVTVTKNACSNNNPGQFMT